ncbi:MAG: precorrin-2 C(20)-methyltransferase [Dehalococcoidales bacterium]|jgi:precorrin-2/cobalt-factor-2 C20-methyltransferase|nr:precorrin-2 C(20)-methyltransferase [Dehalococcoidales bacterium]|tara:strand:- start:1168 stop:1890 length:723 start_codon:yes stop_codon:yes gene_type:complete
MGDVTPRIGRFYGVGVGPGDPELLTLKARNVITTVPVVFTPKKTSGSESIARWIISNLVTKPEQKVMELVFPMLRDKEQLALSWKKAADTVWEHLSSGDDCAFVNVGDPLLYGTFVHVLEVLRKSHPEVKVEVIPGISSPHAAAARGLVPLAIDDERVAIISSPGEGNFIRQVLENFDTVVFMKINRTFDRLLVILEELNLTGKCLYVRRCTTKDEEIVWDVSQLKGRSLDYFSLLIVRK